MNGVIILATEEVASGYTFNWLAFLIAFVVVAPLILFLGWANDVLDELSFYVMLCCVGLAVGVLFGNVCSTPTEYETHYKVSVSNDVSLAEFYEHYEVIEQNGLIFTVKEKTHD